MKNRNVEEKLDNIANTIIFVQIVMVIFNIFYGFLDTILKNKIKGKLNCGAVSSNQ